MSEQTEISELESTDLAPVLDALEEADEEFSSLLEKILVEVTIYEEEGSKEDRLRELMRLCNELITEYEETYGEQPDALTELDGLLWGWFQEPPETTTDLIDNMGESLENFVDLLQGDGVKKEKSHRCEAATSAGDRCRNKAAYPEEEPQYCGIHQDKLEDKETEEETQPEPETAPKTEGEVLITELDVEPEIAADFLMEANEQLATLDNMLVQVEDSPDEDSLNELFRAMHSLKGGFGFCGLDTCTELTHAAEDLLGILRDDIPDTIPAAWLDLMFTTLDGVRAILGSLEDAVEDNRRELEIPLSANFINKLISDLHEACEGETEVEAFASLELRKEETANVGTVGQETINIELTKIDSIVDLVGELVISHSGLREQLEDHIDYQLENTLNQQDKILDQLQRQSMSLRMLPLKKEFNKLPRIVRDISRDLGKEIDLNISGAETEIDKSVLDSLHDPLVHLLRNAIDHGVETPDKRRKQGKSAVGRVDVRAYHESGNVYIEVEDDGAGLPRQAIEQKALEQGLIEEDHSLTEADIDRLIFRPGFSTTEEVSDVSGRGVGMDVVASKIDELRGTIDIESSPGEGTKFVVELPLTVAIIDGLIADIGSEKMIFPVNQVVESVNPTPNQVKRMQDRGRVLKYRDTVIPLIDPGDFIDSAQTDDSIDKRTIYVIVRSNQGRFAIRVDKLYSHEQVVIKNLGKGEIEQAAIISGGAILGDGTVGLILDVAALVEAYRRQE